MIANIYTLLLDDLIALQAGDPCTNCDKPCVEVRGSCQFIEFVKKNLSETLGRDMYIIGLRKEQLIIKDFGTFTLIPDSKMKIGYTVTIVPCCKNC